MIGEQYTTFEQEHATAEFGMWVFLATEVMLFGGLFTVYTVYRTLYSVGFAEGSRHLDLLLGGVNTGVLLVSSLTMALAVHAAQLGERRRVVRYLLLTALLGAIFMLIKGVEYSKHFADGTVPRLAWEYAGPNPAQVQLFFLAYFALTGLHAVHLTIAILVVAVMARLASRGAFPAQRHTPVEMAGLYWHFVDMIWIFLLPLLYLFGLNR